MSVNTSIGLPEGQLTWEDIQSACRPIPEAGGESTGQEWLV